MNLLVTVSAYDDYEEFLQSAREGPLAGVFSDGDVEEVTGAGDFGVWMREMNMLQVYEGDRMVQVTVAPAAGRDSVQAARELAAAALGRAP